jgi:hypothetical protein
MIVIRTVAATVVLFVLTGAANPAYGQGKAARAATKGAAASVRKSMARVFRLDRIRDARTPASRLARPRTTFRYVTPQQARTEASRGIAAGRHLTSRAMRGRPLTTSAAAARYGLPTNKTMRLTVGLPAGTRLRFNKALRGGRGIGEITTTRRVPPEAIRRVVQLPRK